MRGNREMINKYEDQGRFYADMGFRLKQMRQIKKVSQGDLAEVTIGMPVTQHPSHRSQRALLTHWAPASGIDVKTFFRVGM